MLYLSQPLNGVYLRYLLKVQRLEAQLAGDFGASSRLGWPPMRGALLGDRCGSFLLHRIPGQGQPRANP